jgi:arylsulfatase A-like enzyme/tetratricopeptide (TPR) repeat protein
MTPHDRYRRWARRLAGTLLTLGLACTPASDDAASAREAVRAALGRGDRPAAVRSIGALGDLLPATPETSLEIAGLLVQAGSAPDAGWLLEEAVRRDPGRADLRLALARVGLLLGNPSLSRELAASVEPGAPEHPDALLVRAQAELQLGDLATALATLDEAAALHPERVEARVARISLLYSDGRSEEARAAVESLMAQLEAEGDARPGLRLRLRVALAQIQAQAGAPEDAIPALEVIVREAPFDLLAWRAWVSLLVAKGRGDDAWPLLEQTLRDAAAPPALRLLSAQLSASAGRADEAEQALLGLIEASGSASSYRPLLEFYWQRDRMDEAAALLERALERFPDEPQLRLARAERLLDRDRPGEARAELGRLREATFEGDPLIEYLEARIDLAEGRAAQAAERLRTLAPRLDGAPTHFWLGRALETLGDSEGARRRYALAQRRDARWPTPSSALLAIEQRHGRWHEAVAQARRLTAQAPHRLAGYVALVEGLEALGQGAAAERAARQAVARFPEASVPQRLLARALRAQGRTDAALETLDAIAEPGPLEHAERAMTLGLAGRLDEGIAFARARSALAPESAELNAALAALLYAAGDEVDGAAATDRALALAPDEPRPLRDRCVFRASIGRWAEARDDCLRYRALRPEDGSVEFVLGVAFQQLGDSSSAIDAYRRAVALDERDSRARNNLAALLAETGDIDGALAAAQGAYRIAPEDPWVLDTLAGLYQRRGQLARAVSLLEQAHAAAPELAEVERNLERTRRELRGAAESAAPPGGGAAASASLPPSGAHASLQRGIAALARPNLVLIVVDTLRADFLSPYGFDRATSPELASWAERGVLFERARAQSSWTKISMASLLTSLWPRSHAIREARDGLDESAVTVVEALHDAGYATYGVQTNGWLHQSFGFHQGFDRYMFPKGGGQRYLGRPSVWPHADRVLSEAERLLEACDRERPFLLYLHFMDVHEYAAPPSYKRFGTDSRGAYLASIRWVDDAMARLVKALRASSALENSVLVFAADHGETFGEHGVHGHARNVLTPVVSVPLIFRFPFGVEPSLRVPTQVRNLDVAPTLLELAGVAIPESFEGRSLVPLMRGDAGEGDRPAFAALGAPLFPDASVQTALNDGAWTYARNAELEASAEHADAGRTSARGPRRRRRPVAPGAEYLFDRKLDPAEDANLVQHEREQAERMRERLDEHLAGGSAGVVEPGVRIEPGIEQRLRAMGYLE